MGEGEGQDVCQNARANFCTQQDPPAALATTLPMAADGPSVVPHVQTCKKKRSAHKPSLGSTLCEAPTCFIGASHVELFHPKLLKFWLRRDFLTEPTCSPMFAFSVVCKSLLCANTLVHLVISSSKWAELI